MAPDLRSHLESLAHWHAGKALSAVGDDDVAHGFHTTAAADIRASITACDDAEKNSTVRDKKQSERRFAAVPAAPSAFASL